MKNNKSSVAESLGGDAKEPDLDTIKRWTKNDLARAISFLNAIYSDPELLDQIAVWFEGRMLNAKNAQEVAGNGKPS